MMIMKRENASYLAHGIIWTGVLIAAIVGAICGGNPAAMVTTVLIGIMGTFSVLLITNLSGKKTDPNSSKPSAPGQPQSERKPAAGRISELQELLAAGMITQEEFDRKRTEIIQSL
jgi:uncharacterized membrane protein